MRSSKKLLVLPLAALMLGGCAQPGLVSGATLGQGNSPSQQSQQSSARPHPAPPPAADSHAESRAVGHRPFDGVVTSEQASRRGVSGRSECEEANLDPYLEKALGSSGDHKLMAGFVTDEVGVSLWSKEYFGQIEPSPPSVERAGQHRIALCWLKGAFQVPVMTLEEGATQAAKFVVVSVELGASAVDPFLLAAGPRPQPIFAPRPPSGMPLTAPSAMTTPPAQPDGVVVEQ